MEITEDNVIRGFGFPKLQQANPETAQWSPISGSKRASITRTVWMRLENKWFKILDRRTKQILNSVRRWCEIYSHAKSLPN